MNRAAPKLGYWASVTAFLATSGYAAAQIAQVIGLADYPLADILIYASSLCIAAPFLIALLALHTVASEHRRLWTLGALLFGVIYVMSVTFVYMVQLGTVIPRSMEQPESGPLGMAPHSLLWDLDALGYITMGVATLFASWGLPRMGAALPARRFLLANALVTPAIAFIYFYPHFSIWVLMIGLPWLITAPGSLLSLAFYFRALQPALSGLRASTAADSGLGVRPRSVPVRSETA